MNKIPISIPSGIKYISDWKDYSLPNGHCIVDKGVTGCGYTEYCLRNSENVILCSPRRLLLENKADQHVNDRNIIYLKNEITDYNTRVDFDQLISKHLIDCQMFQLPVKFMITYDSIGYLINNLAEKSMLDKFYLVADEFQSIFIDSYFKADVENDFVKEIKNCPNVIYLSATPMQDKYLKKIDNFRDLDFYQMDWSKSGYVEKVRINRKHVNSLTTEAGKIVNSYLSGEFPILVSDDLKIYRSREAVFYFNSVNEIIKIIQKYNLKPDEVNILCSNTEENKRKLKKIDHEIGRIPLNGQPNKMFTFCTSTCYIGADFYSDNASTYVFADPNLKCLALDISLDLPQIAGRQRNIENPFKNVINIYYRTLREENVYDREEFDKIQKKRKELTNTLLSTYENASEAGKAALLLKYKNDISFSKYANDFVSISNEKPVYNEFIEISNERAFDVQQEVYQDDVNVTRTIDSLYIVEESKELKNKFDSIIDDFMKYRFLSTGIFADKLKYYCEFMDEYKDNDYIRNQIKYKIPDLRFNNFYILLGTTRCRALEYSESSLEKELINKTKEDDIRAAIFNTFDVGSRYTYKNIKPILADIYKTLGVTSTAKATDLENYFNVNVVKITDPITKKKDKGYLIVDKKLKYVDLGSEG